MAVRAAGFIIYRRLVSAGPFEYLLLKASYGDKHWTPPKGHVDPGEDDWTTALRETEEEAGLREADLDVVPDFKVELRYTAVTSQRGRHEKVVTYWLAGLRQPEKTEVRLSEEHTELRWLPLQEACELAKFEDMRGALNKCEDKLQSM